jgi:hypothetical protein
MRREIAFLIIDIGVVIAIVNPSKDGVIDRVQIQVDIVLVACCRADGDSVGICL